MLAEQSEQVRLIQIYMRAPLFRLSLYLYLDSSLSVQPLSEQLNAAKAD